MFDFRIIDTPDGNQVIDRRLKTPYSALTAIQMVEYLEMDNRLDYMDRMERKEREEERKRKLVRNPFYRLACFLRIGLELRKKMTKSCDLLDGFWERLGGAYADRIIRWKCTE